MYYWLLVLTFLILHNASLLDIKVTRKQLILAERAECDSTEGVDTENSVEEGDLERVCKKRRIIGRVSFYNNYYSTN